MRYEKGRKDTTRRRVMEIAAARFRSDGVAATGIASIMGEAGLTNGAFYPHFPSKAALVCESVAAALDEQAEKMAEQIATAGLEAAITAYLSPAHRDDPGHGCALAALLPELAREPLATRQVYGDRLLASVKDLAEALPDQTDPEGAAIAVTAILVGTLQLARATAGTPISDRILKAGADAAIRLVTSSAPTSRPVGE